MFRDSESQQTTEPLPFESAPGSERIIVTVDELPTRLGSIILPDKIADRPSSGVVLQVGPKGDQSLVGRRVIFGQSSGVRVKIGDRFFLVLGSEDVLCLVPAGTPAPWSNDASA